MQATTLFGNLQSFMKQALDQAMATQALWHTLSSRQRVSSWPDRLSGTGLPRAAACWGLELFAVLCALASPLEAGCWLNQVWCGPFI